MKSIERVLLLIGIVGFFIVIFIDKLKFMVLLPFMLLSFIYLFFSFALLNELKLRKCFNRESYIYISKKRIFITVFYGMVLFISIWTCLFKFQLWPGSRAMDFIGVALIPLILTILILHIVKYDKYKNKIDRQLIIRFSLILVVHSALILTPELAWAKIRFSKHPGYINAIEKLRLNPSDTLLQKKVFIERQKAFENK